MAVGWAVLVGVCADVVDVDAGVIGTLVGEDVGRLVGVLVEVAVGITVGVVTVYKPRSTMKSPWKLPRLVSIQLGKT